MSFGCKETWGFRQIDLTCDLGLSGSDIIVIDGMSKQNQGLGWLWEAEGLISRKVELA